MCTVAVTPKEGAPHALVLETMETVRMPSAAMEAHAASLTWLGLELGLGLGLGLG
tara:strand:+ start:343 stop:507 length:165 start_codon:yes stop_codon:yes gene_type:complete